jgi:hypothetical protein
LGLTLLSAHRQLLIGADENTTINLIGYDAPINGKNDNDMYWVDNIQLVIQAVPNFNDDQVILALP